MLMLSSFNAPLTLPTATYVVATDYKTAYLKGSSMNSGVYVIKPEDLSSLPGVVALQITSSINKRGPGQRGSNRAPVLVQAIALDESGRQQITSFNTNLTEPNFFVPPAGVAYDQSAVNHAVQAIGMAYILNASGSNAQSDWADSAHNGIMP